MCSACDQANDSTHPAIIHRRTEGRLTPHAGPDTSMRAARLPRRVLRRARRRHSLRRLPGRLRRVHGAAGALLAVRAGVPAAGDDGHVPAACAPSAPPVWATPSLTEQPCPVHVSQAMQHTLRCCMPTVLSGQGPYCKEHVWLFFLSLLAFCMHAQAAAIP